MLPHLSVSTPLQEKYYQFLRKPNPKEAKRFTLSISHNWQSPRGQVRSFPTAGCCQGIFTSTETNEYTCVSLVFPNQLEPVGRKTETLNLTADLPLSCPTQVIREGLLYFPPETQSSDLSAPPPSFSTTAFSLPILPFAWEWMDFRG